MRVILTALLLFFALVGNAQLNLEWGTSLSVGATGYAPSFRVYQMGFSPQVGLFVEAPIFEWISIRAGGAFTLTEQKRPHLRNNFAYFGLPISMIIDGGYIGQKQALKPVFMTRFHPAWQLDGPPGYGGIGPKALTSDYRGLWGAGLGFLIEGGKRKQELLLTASLSNPLNANYQDGSNIEALLGTRIALEWNLKL